MTQLTIDQIIVIRTAAIDLAIKYHTAPFPAPIDIPGHPVTKSMRDIISIAQNFEEYLMRGLVKVQAEIHTP